MTARVDLDALEEAAREWQSRGWNGGDIGPVDILQLISDMRRLRLALVEIEKHNWSLGEHGSILVTVKAIAALLNKTELSPEEIYGYHHGPFGS